MRPVTQRLADLQEKLADSKFRDNRGLGNEVGFYIFDYEPTEELIVRDTIIRMKDYLERSNPEFRIQVFDLYDIILAFFEKRNYMEKNFAMEQKKGSLDWYEKMQQALKIATDNDWIIQYISENIEEGSIIFITGVGKAYPIIRSHIILNNLQPIVEDNPLVLFYPGLYEDGKLKLFGKFEDDHYYRAFKIIDN